MKESKAWIRVVHCCDIPMREGRAVQVGNREIAIFNLGERFVAIENRCPHKGGPLADGIVSGTTVVCPLHAWRMSLETGRGVSGPSASSCVQTFRTRVEDGVVLLELSLDSPTAEDATEQDLAVSCFKHERLNATNEPSMAP